MITRAMALFIYGPTFTICENSAVNPENSSDCRNPVKVSFGNFNLNCLRINSVRYGDRQWTHNRVIGKVTFVQTRACPSFRLTTSQELGNTDMLVGWRTAHER